MLRRYIDLHALLVNSFEHRVLRIEPNDTANKSVLLIVGVLNLHRDKNRWREPGRDVRILNDRMLRIKGSAEYSRGTCVGKP